MDLIQDEVQVLFADLGIDDHHPEEVRLVPMGLVTYHHAACLHHALFNHRSHLEEARTCCTEISFGS